MTFTKKQRANQKGDFSEPSSFAFPSSLIKVPNNGCDRPQRLSINKRPFLNMSFQNLLIDFSFTGLNRCVTQLIFNSSLHIILYRDQGFLLRGCQVQTSRTVGKDVSNCVITCSTFSQMMKKMNWNSLRWLWRLAGNRRSLKKTRGKFSKVTLEVFSSCSKKYLGYTLAP